MIWCVMSHIGLTIYQSPSSLPKLIGDISVDFHLLIKEASLMRRKVCQFMGIMTNH